MQLILHIGTHKTGTSSLQEFLRLNDRALTERGVYYARRPNAKNSNYLAKLIASKQIGKAQAFIKYNIEKAKCFDRISFLFQANQSTRVFALVAL